MLKLVYDLKAGFEDCYLTKKNAICDLTRLLEIEKLGEVGYLDDVEEFECREVDLDAVRLDSEESFYQQYKDDIAGLLSYLEVKGLFECLKEESISFISGTFFAHMLSWDGEIPVWEPSNWQLEYDPNTRSSFYYDDAMSAHEVCEELKLTRQQLHYYVKTNQIRKEFNPRDKKQFRYNRLDVQVIKQRLSKKYKKFHQ